MKCLQALLLKISATARNSAVVPGSAHRVLTCDQTTDEAVWEGQAVKRTDPIPQ